MKYPTYQEQFDKITEAYFKNELEPLKPCACFIGNLLNGKSDWYILGGADLIVFSEESYKSILCIKNESNGFYTLEEIFGMERLFIDTIYYPKSRQERAFYPSGEVKERLLFEALDKTLDMLRKIHESKGEKTEFIPLKKRELV